MSTPGKEWIETTLPMEYELRKGNAAAGKAKMVCRDDQTKKLGPCTVGLLDFVSKASDGKTLTFQLSTHLAGGIFRVVYDDTELVYPMMITGGSLQSDVYYDGECELPCQPHGKLNPTENGSTYDRYTGKSSSRLLSYEKSSDYVKTSVLGAYFSGGGTNPLTFPQPSDVKISKTIRYLSPGEFNYSVTFEFPSPITGALFVVHAGWIPDVSSALTYAYVPRKGGDAWYDIKDAMDKFAVSKHHLMSPFGIVMSTEDGERAFGFVPIRAPKQNGVQLKCRLRAGVDEPGWSQNGWKKFNIISATVDDALDAGTYTWTTRMFFGSLQDVQDNVRRVAMIVDQNDGPDDLASGFRYKE